MAKSFRAYDVREACAKLKKCHDVLLIGLASYGEIERLDNAQSNHKICGREIHENLRVIHPTGSADTVSEFATALSFVDILMCEIRDLAEREPVAAQADAPKEVQS